MITHCEHCDTYFRVTSEQLGAHEGQVRCGRCGQVFNALGQLNSESSAEIIEPVPAEMPKEAPLVPPPATVSPEEILIDAPLAEEPGENATQIVSQRKSKPFRRRREINAAPWLWLVASMVLIAGLVLQSAYFFRNELAAHNPELRPALDRLCALLQCEIELLRNPDLINIEASDLIADPDNPDIITVNVALRNRAPFAQPYPLLELTLTDAQNALVARRVFKPSEYLTASSSLLKGIQPKSEVVIHLRLQLDNLKAAGYRVYLFYP